MNECRLILGDCLEVLRGMDAGRVDAIVADPPAGINFMGEGWDSFGVPAPKRSGYQSHDRNGFMHNGRGLTVAASARNRTAFIDFLTLRMAECLRVLKSGGYALVWAIPRTSHWTAAALEDAGFEVRDRLTHLFAQGFPKAKSCLKPAAEDWWLCRKPAPCVAPLSIDECRIPVDGDEAVQRSGKFSLCPAHDGYCRPGRSMYTHKPKERGGPANLAGRWPANVCLSHHDLCTGDCHPECPVRLLDEQAGEQKGSGLRLNTQTQQRKNRESYRIGPGKEGTVRSFGDSGGASRFFFCAKASKKDRGEDNTHPTVKPQALMQWLVKLISRPGDVVLDPFAGSGTTGVACQIVGRNFIGIEVDSEYHALAHRRLTEVCKPDLFGETHLIVEGQST